MNQANKRNAILEAEYRMAAHWAHPIRSAIENNPRLAKQDEAWSKGSLSDRAFAIETRLTYSPRIIMFLDDNLKELNEELGRGTIAGTVSYHLSRGAAFAFSNDKAVQQVLFGATAFITESRSCFENLADFYRLFLEVYCNRTIKERDSYNVVAMSTGESAWADALRRIRGDLIHERSLFLAFDIREAGWPPIFSMNWRPGHFGPDDRIELRTLVAIWEGLSQAAVAMQAKIVQIARQEAHD